MEVILNEEVEKQISTYPKKASDRLFEIRRLILDVAEKSPLVNKILETTKWGEPSYITKTGSTIRMDWKEKFPDQCCLYFICTTELVSNFRMIFGDELIFEGNRAICLPLDQPLPEKNLRKCIELALHYKKIKHLPMLGV